MSLFKDTLRCWYFRASAVEYYDLAKNTAKVIECYYHLEDWKNLEGMTDILPAGDPLLESIGDMFASNAVHNEAVKAYVKLGKVKQAINLCILYNKWDMAIDLARKHNISKISDLLIKYTSHLVAQKQIMSAIQVNIQTEHYLQAAEHVFLVCIIYIIIFLSLVWSPICKPCQSFSTWYSLFFASLH